MRKIALLLAAAMLLSMSACGQKAPSDSSAPSDAPATSPAPSASPAPATSYEIPAPTIDDKPVVLKQFEAPTGPVATMKTSMGDIEIMLFPEEAPKAVENFITHAKAGYYDGLLFHRVINDFMLQGGDPLGTGTGGESIWGAPFEDEFSDSLHNFRGALSMANSGINTNGSQFFIVQTGGMNAINNDPSLIPQVLYTNLMNHQVALAQGRIAAQSTQLGSQEALDGYIAQEQAALDKLLAEVTQESYTQRIAPVAEKYKEVGGAVHLDNVHTVFGQVIKGMEVVDAIAAVEVTDPGTKDKPREDVKILSITITEP